MRHLAVALGLFLPLLCVPPCNALATEYLYQRDVKVPAYQTLREFFDMPDRPGRYEVSMYSESIGPLTFRVTRVQGEHEHLIGSKRSYSVGSHDFQQDFDNGDGKDDLMVKISNSNPAAIAVVSVYVVELLDTFPGKGL